MAFQESRFVRHTLAFNAGQITTADNPSVTPILSNGPAIFTYASADDTLATIAAANYFAPVVYMLSVNDRIDATGSDASGMYIVSAVDRAAGTISLVSYSASGVVATANIQDGAVTTIKIADGAVTSAKSAETLLKNIQVSVSLAQFIGTFTTSFALVAAPGANKKIILHRASLSIDYGGTVLAGGGAMHIQYANTANGAGTIATNNVAAATLIAATADTSFGFSPVNTTLLDSATLNQGLFLAMPTANFTGGTGSAYKVDLWYSVMSVV